MNENHILKNTPLRREKLNPYQYTVSLLQECFRAGIIDRHTIVKIQEQTILILKDLIIGYTKGESSSVKTETAESLLNSVYYSLDAYFGSLESTEACMNMLRPEKIREAYEKGIEAVKECFKQSMLLCNWVLRYKLDVPLEVYKSSVEESIPEFFEQYNIIFGAHDTTCSLDYPLVFDDMNVRGVYYMKNYLQNLKWETMFCRYFSLKDIRKLLETYGRVCRIEYKEVPLNLFEIVVNNSIFSAMSGSGAGNLRILEPQYKLLQESLSNLDASGVRGMIDKSIERVREDLEIEEPGLVKYIRRYGEVLAPRLLNAATNDSLHNIIIVTLEEVHKAKSLMLENNDRMNEKAFKALVNKLFQCQLTESKIAIIKSETRSIADFTDVLGTGCFFGEEYSELFETLNDIELALIGKMLFADGYGVGIGDLHSALDDGEESDVEWQRQYMKFIKGMKKARINAVRDILNEL